MLLGLLSSNALGMSKDKMPGYFLHSPSSVFKHNNISSGIRLLSRLAPEPTPAFLLLALKPQDQLSALQLLVYLMPPCHSDTLERLLKALHKITENCEDSIGIDGQLVKTSGEG